MSQALRILLYLFPTVMLGLLVPLYLKLKWRGEFTSAVAVKALCTMTPVVFCFNGCLVNHFIGFWWMLAAMIFCLIGDVVIERSLLGGMAVFAVAQGTLIGTCLVFAAPSWGSIPLALLLLAVTLLLFRRRLKPMGRMLLPFMLYAVLLMSMLSLALLLPFTAGTALIAGGSLLFAVSDLLLASRLTKAEPSSVRVEHRRDAACLISYYGALYLFALSVWL